MSQTALQDGQIFKEPCEDSPPEFDTKCCKCLI